MRKSISSLVVALLFLSISLWYASGFIPVVLANHGEKPSLVTRGLWVWSSRVITNQEEQSELFDFCDAKGVRLVYVNVGGYLPKFEGDSHSIVDVAQSKLAEFVASAHARKIRVYALDGDPSWAYQSKHSVPIERLQRALQYNERVPFNRRLDGFQFDIEPYLLPEAETQWHDIVRQYLDLFRKMRDIIKRSPVSNNFTLSAAIPFWWDMKDDLVSDVSWQGISKPIAFHLADLLDTLPAGEIALMDYRDTPDGPDGSIAHAIDEIQYINENTEHVVVFVGQETGNVKPPKITFWEEGEEAIEAAAAKLIAAFKKYRCFGGIAIHHYKSYLKLVNDAG